MNVLEVGKEMVRLVQQVDNIELYRKILEYQSETLKVVEELTVLKGQLKALQEIIEVKENLSFRDNKYWIKKEGLEMGPYCTHCWDREGKLVHLHQDSGDTRHWFCITHGGRGMVAACF